MALVLRRQDDPSFEVVLEDKPISLGTDVGSDVRLAGDGIAARHLLLSHASIEALADVEVGGVRLRAGRRRLSVPTLLRFGATTLTIENAEDSVATREVVLRLTAVSSLWPRILVVEGPSSGRELTLLSDRVYAIGRDPGSDLAVDDPQMSRVHFEVEFREDAVFVRAVGSPSSVRLGGADLEPRRKAAWPAHRMLKAGASVFAFVEPPGLAYGRSVWLHTRPHCRDRDADHAASGTVTAEAAAIDAGSSAPPPSGEPPNTEAEAAPHSARPHEAAVLSARGAPSIARIDERSLAPGAAERHLREPFALRLAFVVFVIASVSCLAALAYVLIF